MQQTPKGILENALYQWALDTLACGCRLDMLALKAQAMIFSNDLLIQHQSSISEGILEAGAKLRLPQLEGNAGSSWLCRWMKRKVLSLRMTNLEFKIDSATKSRRIKVLLERVLHIRWLHYYLHNEKQTLRFSNSDEKPSQMISAAGRKTIARKGKRSNI